MASYAPSALFALLSVATVAVAQDATASVSGLTWAPTPLVDLHFPTPSDVPYKVWPDEPAYARGPQSGFNMCNSTTENQDSMCQTMFFNGMDDFCLWAPAKADSLIADTEGEVIAHCSKKGHGTRLMVEGAIKGMQLLKTKDYWMITGSIDMPKLNIQNGDFGGELDSGSQDGRGNPIGGLVYSTAFKGSANQVSWWTEFIGNNQFCLKICNPDGQNQSGFCQHTLDRIGLGYNCPSKYTVGSGTPDGDFEVCDSDNMGVPGVYVDTAGATQSYSQPPESAGPITTVPYQPSTVASSNCQKMTSAALFTDLVAATGTPAGSASGSGSAKPTGSASGSGAAPSGSGSKSGSSASPSATGNGAARLAAGSALSALIAGAVFVAFL